MRERKLKYFKKLLLNGAPSVLGFIGALIASQLLIRIAFVIFAIGVYVFISYTQAAAMIDNDNFHERIGASIEGLKRAGLVPKSIRVNGKPIDKE
ncbi:hypothetical protein LH991_16230 [Schleiferilactobacillus harbinensis]|uniref:hypothetical protein n=1 Tax=Schleiferilactobacillus harbinensis TaxID=304207 RepID=UPI0004826307|nr:hypothetical protein [Schleiferilactobacillus harbinensis]QFR62511.1 hypothetical protein LH991_00080 [Schleiferilactobacillus harbinensis]QFR65372.1 hypothetical protein LH991_16230 [Schleiferilactobacillus harbinensis]